ncbi:ephrin type-B receptor 1-B [Exaiptasia diaphana]|uniref:receptor protein-tyrosine kinase n=1 Tax=Exaiptasia diaphana TaxID=2652724 RepID=A0A913XBV5_EXADI|nr:ephrin type-B receptor 1-B [Exaiptasia diaphana]
MKCALPSALSSLILVSVFIAWCQAETETIIEVPYKKADQPKWIWSWTSQWTSTKDGDGKVLYQVCDVSSSGSEPNKWIRTDVFRVGDATRIDVTVQYAVSNCSTSVSLAYCKEALKLYVYNTATQHKVPEPWQTPDVYHIFGITSPTNRSTGSLSRNFANTEKHSFLTNPSTPYYYLAIQYQGGCFELYSVTISYSVCPSLALPTGLIQLPRTIAPANGTIRVPGSCAENAQPLADNATLYGNCKANGEWSSQVISDRCLCKAGYGRYLNGSGAVCKDCPPGTYQNAPAGKKCKQCPLNSVQDSNKKECICERLFYRTNDESIFDNCTGQPSEPRDIMASFINATLVVIQWKAPSDLGGRTDDYYQVECRKCGNDDKNCTGKCDKVEIIHSPKNSRKSTVKHLSVFTYYQFKVFSMNGVTQLAEKNGEKPKYAKLTKRTSESVPGVPLEMTAKVLNSTSVHLSWIVFAQNGLITYYQISYYPVGENKEIRVVNTTENSIIITGLEKETKYVFKVRASTSVGLGPPGNITKVVALPSTNENTGGFSQDQLFGVVGGVLAAIVLIAVVVIVVACIYRKKKKRRSDSKLHLANSEFIPLDGHKMYIDPSTYGSPMEALMCNAVEIDSRDLKLDKNIGGGEFADVYKGTLSKTSISEIVAVKILKPGSSTKNKEDFILEASIMGQFKHPNVIELKGVVTRSPDHPMMIVTEFMENGSLDHFLKKLDGKLSVLQQVGICRGVASGMEYLSEMNFIHRDLAARNILVADNMASKISDFGLSRELEDNPDSEYQTQGGKIPIRWTAPEAIRYRKFSSASDVWSYGILVWEIMSFGERPYWEWDNFEVMGRVDQGYRLPAPMNCPKTIHNIMLDCWEKDKNNRPKFSDIVKQLDELIRSPEKISDQPASRFSTNGEANFGEVKSVEDWLTQIKMDKYADLFKQAGYVNLDQVKSLEEDDLKGLGIQLIGHRNKMRKSIKAMKIYDENKA